MTLSNYLEDDWDDNALSGRSSAEKDVFRQYGAGGAGDILKGAYRPLWNIESGSPGAANGQLELPDGSTTNQTVSTPSALVVGAWACDVQFTSTTSDTSGMNLFLMSLEAQNVPDNSYHINYEMDDEYRLRVRSGGTSTDVISSTHTADTSFHTIKCTRDSYGGWELFHDGTSQGTATDATITDSSYLVVRNAVNTQVNCDNLVIQ